MKAERLLLSKTLDVSNSEPLPVAVPAGARCPLYGEGEDRSIPSPVAMKEELAGADII